LGSHIATVPFKVSEQFFAHPLTDRGSDAFLEDWEKSRPVVDEIIHPPKRTSPNGKLLSSFTARKENPEGKTEGYKCRNQAIQKRRKNLPAKRRELAPSIQAALQTFSKADFTDGALPAKTKQLIAVAVAHVTQSPYCIQGHTKTALRHGATQQEIVEAIWVAAEMRAGGAYAHSPISLTALDEQHGQAPVTA